MPTTRRIFVHLPLAEGACRHYRTLLPYRHCVDLLRVRHGVELVLSASLRVRDLAGFDGAVLLREAEPDLAGLLLAESAARSGTARPFRLAWNVDDDLWSVPDWSPARSRYADDPLLMARLTLCRRHADFAWASTPALAARLEQLGVSDRTAVRVLPNLLDLRDWPRAAPWDAFDAPAVRVAWAGGTTHEGDLATARGGVRLLLERCDAGEGRRYEFHYFGECDGDLLGRFGGRGFRYHPGVPLRDYPAYLSQVVKPHVFLLPLDDCPFNRSKSPIRWMEAAAAGARTVTNAPWAYPDADLVVRHAAYAEYGDVPDDEKARDWADAIERAATDPDLPDGRGKLFGHAWQNADAAAVWVKAFLELAGVE
jgi:hypothetical protein